MKIQFQYVMAGIGITLLVILGALTLLLPRVQADVATENTNGEVVTAVESTQSDSSDIVPDGVMVYANGRHFTSMAAYFSQYRFLGDKVVT